MATKKQTNLNFDLEEFKRQKEAVVKFASQEVADKVESIKQLLREIKTLVEVSGIEVKLCYTDIQTLLEEVDSLHPEWNSSSMYC